MDPVGMMASWKLRGEVVQDLGFVGCQAAVFSRSSSFINAPNRGFRVYRVSSSTGYIG